MSLPETLPVVGWKERVDFPEWGVRRLRGKVDTGAHTSALHVESYDIRDTPDGRVVHLWFDLDTRRPGVREVTVPLVRLTTVRSSNGVVERRPVVAALIRLGPVTARIELTLTNRAQMRFPLILGREALAGRVTIDPDRVYVLPRPKK